MPAVSTAQRRAIAIAKNNPAELYARNRGLLSMKPSDQEDFARTSESSLPSHVPKRRAYADKSPFGS
jgi:hypothetical protein